MESIHPEIERLLIGLDAAERDARALVDGLSEDQGRWRETPGSWSVAECLDHLATSSRVYLEAMRPAAEGAQAAGKLRTRPALPGVIGAWFVKQLEPPVKSRMRAPSKIRPRPAAGLRESIEAFLSEQQQVSEFFRRYENLDLARVHFQNPFIRVVRFSLATGFHVIPAHQRRHLEQAWRIRRAATAANSDVS